LRLIPVESASEPEVCELRGTVSCKEDVSGLYVPMNDPVRMESNEPFEELDGNSDGLFDRERTLPQALFKRRSLDEFHREVGSLWGGTKVKNPYKAGALGVSCDSHLPAQAGESARRFAVRMQQFQGDLPLHLAVKGPIRRAMPSTAQEAAHLIAAPYDDSGKKVTLPRRIWQRRYRLGAVRLRRRVG
jgi:hypothetical protein